MGKVERLDNSVADTPVIMLALNAIRVKEENNMRRFSPNAKSIADLAESVRDKGAIQPLVVVESPGDDGCSHELWAGFQRYKSLMLNASEHGEKGKVLCRIIPVPELKEGEDLERVQLLTNLAENVKRNELTLIDYCFAGRRLKDKGMSQKEIAKEFGKSDSWVSRVMKFGDLRPEIQKKIANGEILWRVARELPDLDETEQDQMIADVDAAGPGGAKAAIASNKKKKKGKRRGSNAAQDRVADGRGLSAKAAIKAFEENVEKVAGQEGRKSKADERAMDVYANLIKLMTGAIGVKAFHNRLVGVLA
jgi:ParB family chromosome partitioning protein